MSVVPGDVLPSAAALRVLSGTLVKDFNIALSTGARGNIRIHLSVDVDFSRERQQETDSFGNSEDSLMLSYPFPCFSNKV